MIVVEVIGEPVPQGSMSAIPFHRPCPKCKRGPDGTTVVTPCGRARMCVGGRELGANVVHSNRDEVEAWRDAIARALHRRLDEVAAGTDNLATWARQRPCAPAGSVTLGVRAVIERPKGHYTARGALSSEGEAHPEPWRKPDADKLLRAILDALTLAKLYGDDAQAATLLVAKDYAPRGEPAKATILIAPGRQLVAVATALEAMLNRQPTGSLFA